MIRVFLSGIAVKDYFKRLGSSMKCSTSTPGCKADLRQSSVNLVRKCVARLSSGGMERDEASSRILGRTKGLLQPVICIHHNVIL